MSPRLRKGGPSAIELKLRTDLDRTRRELARIKKEDSDTGAAAGAHQDAPELEALQRRVDELEQTKERLSKLYFSQIDENRRRSSKLHEILRVVSQINADLDLDTLLERIAVTIRMRLGFRIVLIRLRSPERDRLKAVAFAGLAERAREELKAEDVLVDDFMSWLKDEFKVSRSYFISHKHSFNRILPPGHVPDLGRREEWEWHPEDVLLVPLFNGAGELVAYFSVDDPVDRLVPSREQIELLEIFGSHAVVAIENAWLYRQLESRTRELEEAGRRMLEINALRSNFVSTVSHELRTPLTAIRAYLDTMLAAGPDHLPGEQLKRFLGIINEESQRLSRLIESVLDLSRFDSGDHGARRARVDLAEILEETTYLLGPMGEAGQVNLKVVNDLTDTHLDADRDQMRQLVLHLGSNAVKFTPVGGSVVLRLTGDEQSVTLQVEDTGIGIPDEALEKIFDRFYQVDSSLVRRYGGTGLGLSICKSIVEWHGGRVSATSVPGRGSCFTVVLPRQSGARVVVRPGPAARAATQDVLKLAVEMVAEVMNAGTVSLMSCEPDGDLVVQAAIGLDERVVREARMRPGQGVSGWVAAQRRPVCVAGRDSTGEAKGSGRAHYRSGTFISVPLEDECGLLGVLNVTDPGAQRAFEAEDCHLLLDLAERVAHAWAQVRSLEASQSGVEDTAAALRRVVEHLRVGRRQAPDRVRLAQAIARELRLPEEDVGVVGFAATLHDVGMTMVSQDILSRRGALTDEEKRQVRRHVELGAELLRPLETMGAVREVVLSHHEWWDGSGYPRGLEGTQIPIGARVLAVVDAFESMTCGRAHREPITPDAALTEIVRLKGRQFDPDVVEAFERVLLTAERDNPAAAPARPDAARSDARR